MIFHNKQLIIFDLDGTLVDSAPDIAAAANAMRVTMGYPEQTLEQVKQWVGNGSAMLVKRALADARQVDENSVDMVAFERGHELFFQHYRQSNGLNSILYDGVLETLEQLQKRGIQQAICTNKPAEFTHALLKKLGIEHFFKSIVSGDTLPVKKPDPAPLLLCAEQCQAKIDQCLMVGDSMTDVKAALNAKIEMVAVAYGYHRSDNLSAHCTVVDSLSQLRDF